MANRVFIIPSHLTVIIIPYHLGNRKPNGNPNAKPQTDSAYRTPVDKSVDSPWMQM
jgi:hypothetical protein